MKPACMVRVVEPEFLDELPPGDAQASGSRADLRRLNRIMGHARILTRAFRNSLKSSSARPSPMRICELGSGDGTLFLTLARRWAALGVSAQVLLLDRQNIVAQNTRLALEGLHWPVEQVVSDVFTWVENCSKPVDLVVCNLFLHHFANDKLRTLFERVSSKTDLFIACEPRRARSALAASRLLGFIGCNRVTQHDAAVSVRAGFQDEELSALWPSGKGWTLSEAPAGLFSHCFIAKRNG